MSGCQAVNSLSTCIHESVVGYINIEHQLNMKDSIDIGNKHPPGQPNKASDWMEEKEQVVYCCCCNYGQQNVV